MLMRKLVLNNWLCRAWCDERSMAILPKLSNHTMKAGSHSDALACRSLGHLMCQSATSHQKFWHSLGPQDICAACLLENAEGPRAGNASLAAPPGTTSAAPLLAGGSGDDLGRKSPGLTAREDPANRAPPGIGGKRSTAAG